MSQPTFRLQRSVRADAIRPGAHLALDDEIVVLDEVTIGREHITLACFPEGRTDGRRRLVHAGLDDVVHEVPSTIPQIEGSLSELLDGRRGYWRDDTLFVRLGEWELHVDGAPRPAAATPFTPPADMLVVPLAETRTLATGGIVDTAGLTLVGEA